jgi:hypothetical protein
VRGFSKPHNLDELLGHQEPHEVIRLDNGQNVIIGGFEPRECGFHGVARRGRAMEWMSDGSERGTSVTLGHRADDVR